MSERTPEDAWTRRAMVTASVLALVLGPACATNYAKLEDPGKVAGKGMKDAKRRIKKYVKDTARRDKALAKLEEAQSFMGDIAQLTVDAHDERVKIPIAEQTESHLRELMAHYQGLIHDKFMEVATTLMSMREVIDEGEWRHVFPAGGGAA